MTKLEVKHSYSQAPEKLFNAFLNADSARNFMFKTETGKMVQAEVDGQLGGTFTFVEQRSGLQAGHYGTFIELEEPSKIAFIFTVDKNSSEGDYIEIYFNKTSAGCDIVLNHDIKAEFAEHTEKIKSGWIGILDKLDQFISNQEVGVSALVTKDSLGQQLNEGDSVKTIKDLKVKGSSMVVKRGTVVKKIHLIAGNDEEVDCKVDGVALSLETQWLVKV
ncbi:PhnA domain-containing protein [bacterium]|nr:PhnA domain-containing protein [bacterium]